MSCTFNAQDEWNFLHKEKGVKIYTKEVFCEAKRGFDSNRHLLSIRNTSSKSINFSMYLQLWKEKECINCYSVENQEFIIEMHLEPNQTINGECDSESNHNLSIFKEFNDPNYNGSNINKITKLSIADFKLND